VGRPLKHGGMSLEEITQAEGMSVGAVNTLLCRALRKLRKLRRQGLLLTCRELAEALDANRKGIVE
jgi:hypothetical protein